VLQGITNHAAEAGGDSSERLAFGASWDAASARFE